MESDVKLEKKLREENDPKMIRLRKDRNILMTAGTGVLFFGIWSIVKTCTGLFESSSDYFGDIQGIEEFGMLEIILAAVFVSLILSFDLLVRIYIGMNSRAEAGGKRKGSFYLVVAGLLAFASVFFLNIELMTLVKEFKLSTLVETIVELTSLIILIELMISAIRIKAVTGGKRVKHAG